jgi:hypothetical protein
MSNPRIVYQPREDASTEVELRCLAEIYKFVLFEFQARKGEPYALTTSSTAEIKNGSRKPEQEKT